KDGSARSTTFDKDAYVRRLERMLGGTREVMRGVVDRARRGRPPLALAAGDDGKTLPAAAQLLQEGVARPPLLGEAASVRTTAERLGIDLDGLLVVDPRTDARRDALAERLFARRQRKGLSPRDAQQRILSPRRFAMMLLDRGDVEGAVCGMGRAF